MLKNNFSQNLKKYRIKNNLTQKELADKIDYSEKSIYKWESGVGMPSLTALTELSKIFDVKLDDLLFKNEDVCLYLGIDGGASKTVFLLCDSYERELNRVDLGPTNPNDVGFEISTSTLRQGIVEACKGHVYSNICLYAGLSGGKVGGTNKILKDFFSKFGFRYFRNGSDFENAIELGIDNKNGVIVIIGTGIISYCSKGGKEKQIGGWGQFFDDGGSGYNYGRDAIMMSLRYLDGTGKPTVLKNIIEERLGGKLEDNLNVFYKKGKSFIASFCRQVFFAAAQGDEVANEIIDKNVLALAHILEACKEFMGESPVKIAFTGSLTNDWEVILSRLGNYLDLNNYDFKIIKEEQVVGAVRIAKREGEKYVKN